MFRRYQPKGMKLGLDTNSVRMTNTELAFSDEVWEKCFEKTKRMALFFDADNNLIGLKPDDVGNVVSPPTPESKYKVVRWIGFIKSIKFDFASPVTKKIKKEGELWVVEK